MTAKHRKRLHTCHYPACRTRTFIDRIMCSMHWVALSPEEKSRVYPTRGNHNDCEPRRRSP